MLAHCADWHEEIFMEYYVGQELSFWHRKHKRLDTLIVTKIFSNDLGFQFFYRGKVFNCTYERAEGKLYSNPYDVPEFQEKLRKEKITEEEKRIIAHKNSTIEPSCEICFHRWSGECTTINSKVCKDYRAGPVNEYSTHGPTADNQDYRPIWL